MNILEKIIADKQTEVDIKKKLLPLEIWQGLMHYNSATSSLKESLLEEDATGIIAEYKRRSPSKGVINNEADVYDVTAAYDQYASGISILTDEKYFGGLNDDILLARDFVGLPILRKDFIVDEYQLHEAKGIGADAILLIAACLPKAKVKALAKSAKKINLEVLLELHGEEELDHICDEVDMIGINNRNLKTFEVDIERSLRMAEKIPADKIKIAESGISSVENILLFRKYGFKGFLIGEKFMKEKDPGAAFELFVHQLKMAGNED